jgi:hypothetical protein
MHGSDEIRRRDDLERRWRSGELVVSISADARIVENGDSLAIILEEFPGALELSSESLPRLLSFETESNEAWRPTSRGIFSVVAIDFANSRIVGCSDMLGIWPLYVGSSGTSRAIGCSIDDVVKSIGDSDIDFTGVLEESFLGYGLGRRTTFRKVQRLRESERVQLAPIEDVRFHSYSRLRELCGTGDLDNASIEGLRIAFLEAVADRGGVNASRLAFLSGGLDSRAIVSCLADAGSALKTYCFAPSNSQDAVLAAQAAARLGVDFVRSDRDYARRTDWGQLFRDSLGAATTATSTIAWSGDGGSVCVGAVYCSTELSGLFKEPLDSKSLAARLAETLGVFVPRLSFSSNRRRAIENEVLLDLEKEIEHCRSISLDQASFLFFLLNDQRRHLDFYFSRLRTHRIRYLLPFFSPTVVRACLSVRLDVRLYHRFYMRWFETLPAAARETAWQTYPDHEKCPIPIPDGLTYQWSEQEESKASQTLDRLGTGVSRRAWSRRRDLGLSTFRLLAAIGLHESGLRTQAATFNFISDLLDTSSASLPLYRPK